VNTHETKRGVEIERTFGRLRFIDQITYTCENSDFASVDAIVEDIYTNPADFGLRGMEIKMVFEVLVNDEPNGEIGIIYTYEDDDMDGEMVMVEETVIITYERIIRQVGTLV